MVKKNDSTIIEIKGHTGTFIIDQFFPSHFGLFRGVDSLNNEHRTLVRPADKGFAHGPPVILHGHHQHVCRRNLVHLTYLIAINEDGRAASCLDISAVNIISVRTQCPLSGLRRMGNAKVQARQLQRQTVLMWESKLQISISIIRMMRIDDFSVKPIGRRRLYAKAPRMGKRRMKTMLRLNQ